MQLASGDRDESEFFLVQVGDGFATIHAACSIRGRESLHHAGAGNKSYGIRLFPIRLSLASNKVR